MKRNLRGSAAAGSLFLTMLAAEAAHVKGLTLMVSSLFNGWRMEDVWLDK